MDYVWIVSGYVLMLFRRIIIQNPRVSCVLDVKAPEDWNFKMQFYFMRFYICGGKGILSDVSPAVICILVHYWYMIKSIEGYLLTSHCTQATADISHWAVYMVWE